MAVRQGYTISDHGVLVPNPGRHPTTAGNVRINRVRVVKDADGKTMKGKGGGARRKPKPEDGEYLGDKLVMHAFARKAASKGSHTTNPDGTPFAGSLGTAVFAADAHDAAAGRLKQEAHQRGLVELMAAALATGAMSLDDLYATQSARTIRRVMAHKSGH